MRRFFNARFDDVPGAINGNDPRRLGDMQSYARQKTIQENGGTSEKQRSRDELLAGGMSSAGFGRQGSQAQDSKFLEGKLKRLEEELKSAVDDIRSKDLIIKRFSDWQLGDKYLSEDETMRDIIEKSKNKNSSLHEQEAKEMAEAAAQMVKTLQEMLN